MMHVDAPSLMMHGRTVMFWYLNWYLKIYQGGEAWFFVIQIKGDELSISGVDCSQGRKKIFSL